MISRPYCYSLLTARFVLAIGFLSGCCADSTAQGEETIPWVDPSQDQLAEQITKIDSAMQDVNRLLQEAPDANAWRDYMLWGALQAAVHPQSDTDVLSQDQAMKDLVSVYNRLANDFPGLERNEVQNLRQAVRVRICQLNARLTRRGEDEANARRTRLTELIAHNQWTASAQSEYATHIRWLDDHWQPLPEYALAAEEPNVHFRLSTGFIRNATLTSVSDPTPVDECILETRVIGDGVTSGVGWLSPIDANGRVLLVANFSGTLRSDTVGYNGPVRVFSDGTTQLRGSAKLELSSRGLNQLDVSVAASADSQTKGVATKFRGVLDRLVRRVAYRKIAESKAQANAESSLKARRSFSKRFAADIEKQVFDGDQAFQRFLRLPLIRRDLLPTRWDWSSDTASIQSALAMDGRGRPTAVAGPTRKQSNRPLLPGAAEISIHQSFFDNVIEGYFAGRELRLSDLAQSSNENEEPADDAVVLRLDDFHPLRTILDNNHLTFHLLNRNLIAGGSEYPALVIKVEYRLEQRGGDWVLVRSQAPTIDPVPRFARPPRFGGRGVILRNAVEPMLQEEFPQQIDLSKPAGELSDEVPKGLNDLKILDAATSDGWLMLTLDEA